MLIFAGLGNPGSQYRNNRHNAGFMAVDAVAEQHKFRPWTRKFRSEVSEGEIAGEKVLLVKPQTFMNLSGEPIGEILRFFKLDAGALTVFHDELDLPLGKVRVKTGGGNGGHNGLRSIDAHCGTAYRRVRIGIGHPGAKERVHGHVLGDFGLSEVLVLRRLLSSIADHADLLARGETDRFTNAISPA